MLISYGYTVIHTHLRIDVPVWYADARGEQRTAGKHSMFLPHEVVGQFYEWDNLWVRLTGQPGVSYLN